ncbi:MAG: zinc metallopeptidase [Candidatus Cloacimonetes bacterium]|nr:zinc metallopeptidase [Candidatus Cloacimonadota bacterium]MDD4155903.1 zinc metallopeptidase [Candidatus Cloacimonadota bacterium]
MLYLFDNTILLIIPVLILAFWAQSNVKGTYEKLKKVTNSFDATGAEVAESILQKNGLSHIPVIPEKGHLTDHYHPGKQEVHLSEEVFYGRSIASISIAAHEVGHALQHANGYYPVVLRGQLLPIANIGSQSAMPLFLLGFFFQFTQLMTLGIIFFAAALIFHLVTLPVEFNASSRAIIQLSNGYTSSPQELSYCKKMLNAAALTYVASTLMALMQLIRMILLRNSRD